MKKLIVSAVFCALTVIPGISLAGKDGKYVELISVNGEFQKVELPSIEGCRYLFLWGMYFHDDGFTYDCGDQLWVFELLPEDTFSKSIYNKPDSVARANSISSGGRYLTFGQVVFDRNTKTFTPSAATAKKVIADIAEKAYFTRLKELGSEVLILEIQDLQGNVIENVQHPVTILGESRDLANSTVLAASPDGSKLLAAFMTDNFSRFDSLIEVTINGNNWSHRVLLESATNDIRTVGDLSGEDRLQFATSPNGLKVVVSERVSNSEKKYFAYNDGDFKSLSGMNDITASISGYQGTVNSSGNIGVFDWSGNEIPGTSVIPVPRFSFIDYEDPENSSIYYFSWHSKGGGTDRELILDLWKSPANVRVTSADGSVVESSGNNSGNENTGGENTGGENTGNGNIDGENTGTGNENTGEESPTTTSSSGGGGSFPLSIFALLLLTTARLFRKRA